LRHTFLEIDKSFKSNTDLKAHRLIAQKGNHFHACHEATSDSVKLHKLRKLIAYLSNQQGREMDFVSLYIPPKTSIDEVITFLKREANIVDLKLNNVKNHLEENVKNVINHLKQQKEIPENGLAIFAGAITDNLGKEVAIFDQIAPPKPIGKYVYEVDNHFQLEPLREMLRDQKIIGLIALDSKEAGFGVFIGDQLGLSGDITSGIPGKTGKGGQSQRRYERERDMEVNFFFHRIAEHAAKFFLENHQVTALIVGGPGKTKNEFVEGNYLHYELKNALLDMVDTQFAGKKGVREELTKSSGTIKEMCVPEEKRAVQRILAELAKQNGFVTYGLDLVLEALKNGEVGVAIATDSTDMIEYNTVCRRCGNQEARIMNKNDLETMRKITSTPCKKCKALEYEIEEKDIIDFLEDAASQTDARVEVISAESEEKAKLAGLGGFAALLRYRKV
jgi:peptide chain release factor subunit 1